MNFKTFIKPLLLGVFIGIAFFAGFSFRYEDSGEEHVKVFDDGRLQYKWYSTQVPAGMTFAGEKVPLDQWEIRERLDRELLMNYYMHGSLIYTLKHTTRVFPVIEKKLKENGLPEDFKYLCAAESALRNQISSAGAVGYWQFLKATGIQYGLEITEEVDERYHLEKSTDAACKYLRNAYSRFGSWTAAAASYNCGLGGYGSRSTFQQSADYYNLLLPEETNRYIFRILALKQLISNAEEYGFILPDQDQYKPIPTRKVQVNESIPDLAQYALNNGTNYKILKTLNPWLRDKKLTVAAGKSYTLELPFN